MRMIEKQMNAAILKEIDWQLDNTSVETVDGITTVKLYGYKIAEVTDTSITLFDGRYRTKTTKSRINAILQDHGNGDSIVQVNYQWYLNTGGQRIPFVSGITLV